MPSTSFKNKSTTTFGIIDYKLHYLLFPVMLYFEKLVLTFDSFIGERENGIGRFCVFIIATSCLSLFFFSTILKRGLLEVQVNICLCFKRRIYQQRIDQWNYYETKSSTSIVCVTNYMSLFLLPIKLHWL